MPDKVDEVKSGAGEAAGSAEAAHAVSVKGITVDIYDQTYRLHGEDAEYVRRLAAMIDGKMRAVAAQGKTVDSLRVAVLAALNIADELVVMEEKYRALAGNVNAAQDSMRSRAHSLTGLLDSVLDTGT